MVQEDCHPCLTTGDEGLQAPDLVTLLGSSHSFHFMSVVSQLRAVPVLSSSLVLSLLPQPLRSL